jgi:hypothetical protein
MRDGGKILRTEAPEEKPVDSFNGVDWMTTQEAYQRVSELLEAANDLKKDVDKLVEDAAKIAAKHDLVFEQRYRDALPEVLDPDLYEEVEEEVQRYDYNARKTVTVKERVKRFKDKLPKDFLRENYVEPGDYVDAWIPSSLC